MDTIAYDVNHHIQSCLNDTGCDAGDTCYVGACVPGDAWVDPTLPLQFDSSLDVPGTLERLRFNGSGTDYRIYVSTSLSDEEVR